MTRTRLIVAVAVLGPFFWFFGSILFNGQMFAYRDSAYYYYPLFKWTAKEWSEGRVPLWNPQENLGTPVLADGSSSVLYPGKLVFALPLDFATCFKWYITSHVLLAALGAFLLAKRWKASALAAGLCAIAYAYSGNVLFQYCNVVFLVGAAWLPFALLAADRMLVQRRAVWALVLAAILAMMVLGGDPQCAYHAGLLAALYAWMLRRHDKRQRKENPAAEQEPALQKNWSSRLLAHRFILLGIAAIGGGVFAAAQILPSLELTRRSQRAAYTNPRTIYEAATFQNRAAETGVDGAKALRDGLLGRPTDGHHEHIYQFSVAPWQFAEMIWPNFSGRSFPINRRWTSAIPGGDRVWTPTMYMGLLPLVLALVAWRFRRGTVDQRFMTWTVFLACLGALGWYGIGWIVNELRTSMMAGDPNDPVLGEPVGGLYWLMVTFLPAYVNFRYPAKLMVIATLGLSVLAARGWDQAFQTKSKKLVWLLIGVLVFSLVGSATMLFVHPSMRANPNEASWNQWLQDDAPADDVFGPVDKVGAANDVLAGFLHATLLSIVFLMLFWMFHRGGDRVKLFAPLVAIAITVADLIVAQSWTVIGAPQEIWEAESPIAKVIDNDAAKRGIKERFRIVKTEWSDPLRWRETHSKLRHVEWVKWNQETLTAKHHLSTNKILSGVQTSIQPYEAAYVLSLKSGIADSVLSPRYFLVGPTWVEYDWIDLPTRFSRDGLRLTYNDSALPRTWVVPADQLLWWKPLKPSFPNTVFHRTYAVYFFGGQEDLSEFELEDRRDLRNTAIVESDSKPDLPRVPNGKLVPTAMAAEFTLEEPGLVEVDAELTEPGLVVVKDLFYPGWTVEVIPNGDESKAFDAPILRTNRIMRGVYLPAGKYRLIYRYKPLSFRVGAIVSTVGWLTFGFGLLAIVIVRRRRKKRE